MGEKSTFATAISYCYGTASHLCSLNVPYITVEPGNNVADLSSFTPVLGSLHQVQFCLGLMNAFGYCHGHVMHALLLSFSRRIDKGFQSILILKEFFGFEESFNLNSGGVKRVRSVNKVGLHTHGEVAAYRPRFCLTRFCDATK